MKPPRPKNYGRNMLKTKRIYEAAEPGDGLRVLVDRLWPRGIAKDKIEQWRKELAPSNELRKWIHANPAGWDEFVERYLAELESNGEALQSARELRAEAEAGTVTLLYSVKDTQQNHAVVLAEFVGSLGSR